MPSLLFFSPPVCPVASSPLPLLTSLPVTYLPIYLPTTIPSLPSSSALIPPPPSTTLIATAAVACAAPQSQRKVHSIPRLQPAIAAPACSWNVASSPLSAHFLIQPPPSLRLPNSPSPAPPSSIHPIFLHRRFLTLPALYSTARTSPSFCHADSLFFSVYWSPFTHGKPPHRDSPRVGPAILASSRADQDSAATLNSRPQRKRLSRTRLSEQSTPTAWVATTA